LSLDDEFEHWAARVIEERIADGQLERVA